MKLVTWPNPTEATTQTQAMPHFHTHLLEGTAPMSAALVPFLPNVLSAHGSNETLILALRFPDLASIKT